ncbi:MAG: hypothetical protein AB8B85_02715 [Paracoccaceae bacterium]
MIAQPDEEAPALEDNSEKTGPNGPVNPDVDYLRVAREAYTASTSYFDANIRRQIEQDIRQWQSRHSGESKYNSPGYAGRSRLFRPKTRASIQRSEAQAAEALFSTVDVINVNPWDDDSLPDIMHGKFMEALVKPRLAQPSRAGGVDWYLTCMGAFQDAQVTGVCIGKVSWLVNPNREIDRPAVDLIPIENFRFDPASDWRRPVESSPYLIEMIPMFVRDVQAKVDSKEYEPVANAEILSAAKQVQDSIRQQREDKRTDSKTAAHSVNEFSVVWVHLNIVDIDGEDVAYYTLGTSHLLTKPVPVRELFYHGRCYTIGFTTLEAHKVYPQSPVRLGRELQIELNNLTNQRMDNVSFTLNKRYFVKRGAQVDVGSISRNMPGSSTLMNNPETDVKVVDTPDVTGSSFKEADQLNVEMDDVYGQFSQQSVQSNRNLNETVGGMQLMSQTGNLLGNYRLHTFIETWVEPVLDMLKETLIGYEEDMRRILSAKKQADVPEDYPEEALWHGNVGVRVDMSNGVTNPQERANQILFGFTSLKTILEGGLLEQRGLDIEEVAGEIFAMLGYRDGSRFFQWKDQDPQVLALQGQIEELQQALNAKHPQELIQAQVAKLGVEMEKVGADTVKSLVESMYSSMQAAQVVASVPSVAPVADAMLADAGFMDQGGTGPGIEAPAAPDPALSQRGVMDPRTGVGFVPGGGENPNIGTPEDVMAAEVGPEEPVSPAEGQAAGIETARPDGVQ